MSEAFELHLERHLEAAAERLEDVLRQGPEAWLPGYSEAEGTVTSELLAGRTGRLVRRRIEVRLGSVQRFGYGTSLRLEWRAARHPELFPELDGHLRIEPRKGGGTRLKLDVRYRPPGGRLGATLDRAFMHWVATASVVDFADRLSESLNRAGGQTGIA